MHCWEVLHDLIAHDDCQGMIIDVGMPVRYKSVLYNTRLVFYDVRIDVQKGNVDSTGPC